MSTITLHCPVCESDFQKEKKEYNRRIKNGFTIFYCSLKCAGIVSVINLPLDWSNSEKNKLQLKQNAAIGAILNRKYSTEEQPFYEYYRRAKMRKKFTFDLNVLYLKKLWEDQKGKCAISNIPLKLIGETKDLNIMGSLDRIDSSKGYIKGNVQFVSCALNLAKSNRSDDSVINLIALIKEHAR